MSARSASGCLPCAPSIRTRLQRHPYKKWEWCTPKQLSVGNKLLDYQGNLIEIVSLEHMEGEVEVVNFDVEPLDIYFAGGVLVHNKGASSEP